MLSFCAERLSLPQPLLHFFDGGVRCRSSGSDADPLGVFEPFGPQILSRLHVVNSRTITAAGLDQLMSVIAVSATNCDHHITLPRQLDRRVLPLFGWLAYRVDKTNLRAGKSASNQPQKILDLFYWLRRLRRNTESRMFSQFKYVGLRKHDIEIRQVFRQAAHLYVIAFADDDRMTPFAHEPGHRTVGDMHQRACCFRHIQTPISRSLDGLFGRAMSGNHDCLGFHCAGILSDSDASVAKVGQDGFIMHEVAEDSEGLLFGMFHGQRNGVTNAETHAEVFCTKDSHKLLCVAKYMTSRLRICSMLIFYLLLVCWIMLSSRLI